MSTEAQIQAMVWYKKEDWETLQTIFIDSHLLPKSYTDWLQRAEEMSTTLQAKGVKVVKVYIDPITFPKWCADNNREPNSEARADLALEVTKAQNFSL